MRIFSKISADTYLNFIRFFGLVLLFCTIVVPAIAQQETGQINGVVKDPNGATVPNAAVTAKNVGTNLERTVNTDNEGAYTITNLQPGAYEISATAPGFQLASETVQVTVGSRNTINLTAGVANVGATVDVVEGTGLGEINTTDQQVSDLITGRQILNLPSLDRDPYNLVTLSGNVSTADESGRGVGVAINGQRSAGTNILLDGIENVNNFTATRAVTTPLDSVAEFRVITSNFTAEQGRATGGIVSVVTRAGTNRITGTAYTFNRNSAFAANNFESNANGVDRQNFNRNQFGYFVSGPIVKDKLFFSNSTEFTYVRSNGTQFVYVPTQAFLNAPTTSAATRAFFAGKTLVGTPTGEVTPDGVFQRVQYNAPIDVGGGTPQTTYSTVTRIDYNLNDKTQFFGTYTADRPKFLQGTAANSPYANFDIGTATLNNRVVISGTTQITENFINSTKVGYKRSKDSNVLSGDPNVPSLYTLANAAGSINGIPIAFPGFYPFNPGTGLPTSGTENQFQINQDLNYLAGDHNLRFGGQFIYIRSNVLFPAFQNASLTLGANLTQAIANLRAGRLSQLQVAVDPQGRFPGQSISLPASAPNFKRSNRYNEYALYFQDTWRVVPRLSLNLGVRYEFYGPQQSRDKEDANFYFGTGSTIQEQIRNGSAQIAENSSVGRLYQTDNNNFAPRVGFAFDVFGDGRTSIRGGYGISYERNFGNVTFNTIQNPPFYAVVSLLESDVVGGIQLPTNNFGPLAGNSGSVILPRSSLRHVREDIVNAYTHQYSASFERRIFGDSLVSVDYSGSAGRSLYSIENINRSGTGLRYLGSNNAAVCPATFAPNSRLNCQYSNINTRGNNGYSNYNGVTFSFEGSNIKKSGLSATARYTFSKNKDNLSSTFSEFGNNLNLGLTDPFDPSYDYGPSDFDIRHRFVSSFVYELPFGRNFSNGFAKAALNGFSINGIFTARTGAPFTVFDCSNAITTCLRLKPTGTINFKNPDQIVDSGNPNSFIYTDLSGQTPNSFTDGVSGGTEVGPYPTDVTRRNSFRGPGRMNFDFGIIKDIGFTERYKLQIRGEFINAFNMTDYLIVGSSADISSNSFVQATKVGSGASNSPRTIQFSAKFLF